MNLNNFCVIICLEIFQGGFMKNKFKICFTFISLLLICLLLGSCSSYFSSDLKSIKSTDINELGELVIYYTDGTFENLGVVVGENGKNGENGKDGADGENGKDGLDGKDGIDGADGSITIIDGSVDTLELAINKCLSNVVAIESTFSKYEVGILSEYHSAGSGVVYTTNKETGDAIIITNYHVIYDEDSTTTNGISSEIKIYPYGYYHSGVNATYLGGSSQYDIAVLKITNCDHVKNSILTPASLRSSSSLGLGESTFALGNPQGNGIAATIGVLSLDSENIEMDAIVGSGTVNHRLLRTDTPINPGNSGGGLFDGVGNLIGIVNAKSVESDVDCIGYAIPSDVAIGIVDNILYYYDGTSPVAPKRVLLGITIGTNDSYTIYNSQKNRVEIKESVYVEEVSLTSVALGSIKKYDILKSIKINDKDPIETTRQFTIIDALLYARVGDTLIITFERNGALQTFECVVTDSMLTEFP